MAWTTPITWTAAQTVTAAQANTEIRDHLNWLKGFADLVTNSTASDSGTATYLNVVRATGAVSGLTARVTGDAVARFDAQASGEVQLAPDGTAGSKLFLTPTVDGKLNFSVTGAGVWPQFNVRLPSAALKNALTVDVAADTAPRLSLGIDASSKPQIAWGPGNAAADTYFTRDVAGRIIMNATGTTHVRLGSQLGDTSTDANSVFVWASGDTNARIAIGQDASGRPKLTMGAGGATSPDWTLYRTAARVATSIDQFDLQGGGLILPIKAGAFTDADVPGAIKVGAIGYNQTGNTLMVRDNDGTWKTSAALT